MMKTKHNEQSQQQSKEGKMALGRTILAAVAKGMLLCVLLALIYCLTTYFKETIKLDEFKRFVGETGPLAPLVYMAIYLIAPTIFFPASVLTMTGGALFGPIWGTAYTIVSATVGATIPFLITRHFGRGPLEGLVRKYQGFDSYFDKFQDNVARDGWKYIAFTRLVTVFPFLILNYAFGLTRVSIWTYMWSSFVFMLPGSFMFNYIGYAGREALVGGEGIVAKISVAVGCFILLTALPTLIKSLSEKKSARQKDEV